uniref:Calcium voltage-gated channel auxiliary subunit alpha2delta 4 n=1 Tax=Oncorhynchus kisutch TaxID=8019 RepID=A0A8C7IWK1_ONCKI
MIEGITFITVEGVVEYLLPCSFQKLKDVESIIKIVDIDGRDQVRDFAEDMERMLGSKMKSVKRLAESAEDADLYHDFNKTLEFDYYNSMLVNTADEDGNFIELGGEFPLEKNKHFNNLPVNTLQSDVQVPTNVYNKDAYILNGIYWSEALNDVFMNNFQKDPTLTWQYFGSSSGFFRIYPGIKWTPDSNGVAAFDCRNRNWYIQAATSPKDIIIVVDISGSMKGLKMTIAKHTINTILDTLGENDFVNVIAYTDYVRYVEPCFKGTLVQADLDNREHFKVLVDELHVKGEGKVAKAMKESFKILNEAATKGQGSLCNQAIMLITDGAMEDFKDVFEEFNWPDRRVRLFTYLIGREMTFADNTKWIACNNKGYYTHISTLADVQENVMEYLHVLSRPMVINHNHDIIWTEAYMDTVLFATKAQSLLLMTTVAMPVFSKKKETLSHGILLGVVGSDIPLLEVMKLAPRYRLGPHGYAFLITNNGYILAHPDLRPLYKEGKTLKPKPNYNSVDLAEVEWEDIDEIKRPLFLTNDYFYTTINDTPFRVLDCNHLLALNGPPWSETPIVFPFRTYCETDIDPHHRKYSQLQAVIRYLQGKEPDLECDEVLLQQTLFDAVVTAPLESYWQAIMLNASGMEMGVETAFLGTRSGLIRLTRYTGIETRVAKTFLTPADKDNLFTVDHFPLWYRLAMENPPGRFIYYIPVEDKDNRDKTGTIPIIQGWGPSLSSMANRCVSNRVSLYDYQGMCRSGHSHSSSARPLLSVSHVYQYFLTLKKSLFAETFAMSHKAKRTDALQPCDTEYPGFMLDNSIKETNSLLKCGRCQKMFVVQAVPDSNLVLMVVQADCDCSRQYSSITLEPKEVKYNASVKCNRMKSQKVRRRPKSCHAYHPKVSHPPPLFLTGYGLNQAPSLLWPVVLRWT